MPTPPTSNELTRVARVIHEHEGPSVEARETLVDALRTLSSDVAGVLYADLVKVQICKDGESRAAPALTLIDDWIDWSQHELVERFHRVMIDRGDLTHRVADCIELSPHSRQRKWRSEEASHATRAKLHRERSEAHKAISRFRYEMRKRNEEAYVTVRSRLEREAPSDERAAWKTAILWSEDRLGRQPQTFWYGLQIDGRTLEEKRALVHKLTRCQGDMAAQRANQLTLDLYAAAGLTLSEINVAEPARWRPCWRWWPFRRRRKTAIATVDRACPTRA